jgi:hypothetical protein
MPTLLAGFMVLLLGVIGIASRALVLHIFHILLFHRRRSMGLAFSPMFRFCPTCLFLRGRSDCLASLRIGSLRILPSLFLRRL